MVSVVVPCFNEKRHIEACLRSLLSQAPPPGGLEVLVADGLSSDGTREILENFAAHHPLLRVVDNPSRVTPAGMNVGIREARGRFIAILGAHCHYEADYVKTCAQLLEEHPEASCVGGPIISKGRSAFGHAVAAAMSHPVGIGNARHRYPDYEGYAEGACFPVFRREVFDAIGFYDEALVRNQDDELNYRLTKQGGKVFLSPRARCTYFVRETVPSLFCQYFDYGFWRVAVLKKHRTPASLRQLAPPAFIALLLLSVSLAGLLPAGWRLAALSVPIVYLVTLFGAGLLLIGRLGFKAGLLFPVAAATMHLAYAWGFIRGFVRTGTASVLPRSVPKKSSSQLC